MERETSSFSLSGSLDSSCSGVREICLHLAVNPQGLEQAKQGCSSVPNIHISID